MEKREFIQKAIVGTEFLLTAEHLAARSILYPAKFANKREQMLAWMEGRIMLLSCSGA